MAFGDATLDSIMEEIRGTLGGNTATGAPSATGAPAAPAVVGAPTGAAKVPFYNRPIPIPEGVKAVGRFGAALGSKLALPATLVSLVEPGARLLKAGAEAAANAYAGGPAVKYTPERAAQLGEQQLPTGALAPDAGAQDPSGQIPLSADQYAAAPDNTVVPAKGTGFIRNNTTGVTTYIDGRSAAAPAAPDRYVPVTAAGGFAQGVLGLKNIAGDNALRTARTKAYYDAIGKIAGANKDNAEAGNFALRQQLAAQAQARGADASEVSAILSGRAQGGQNVFFPGLTPNDPVIVGNRATGAVTRKMPTETAKIARGSDGKTYILDATGKPVREATAAESSQVKPAASGAPAPRRVLDERIGAPSRTPSVTINGLEIPGSYLDRVRSGVIVN